MGEGNYPLAILDIDSGKISNTCIPGYQFQRDFPIYTPIWSPDSKYLAVAANLNPEKDAAQSILIDLVHNQAYKITEGFIPKGWMKAP